MLETELAKLLGECVSDSRIDDNITTIAGFMGSRIREANPVMASAIYYQLDKNDSEPATLDIDTDLNLGHSGIGPQYLYNVFKQYTGKHQLPKVGPETKGPLLEYMESLYWLLKRL